MFLAANIEVVLEGRYLVGLGVDYRDLLEDQEWVKKKKSELFSRHHNH